MHADIIIIGNSCDAGLLAVLCARRGLRTLQLAPARPQPEEGPRRLYLEAGLAERLKPFAPPPEAVISPHLTVNLWSPDERTRVSLTRLPWLTVAEPDYCRFLEAQAAASRNLRILRGHEVRSLVQQQGRVIGVEMATGDQLHARMVVECSTGAEPLHQRGPWAALFPQPLAVRLPQSTIRCQVGAAASAWELGSMAVRLIPGRFQEWLCRVETNEVEMGAMVEAGANLKASALVRKRLQEMGLAESPVEARSEEPVRLAPPLLVPGCDGYAAAGGAAGQCNPFLVADCSPAMAGAQMLFVALVCALDEGDVALSNLWGYARNQARALAPDLAAAFILTRWLGSLDGQRLEQLFKSGFLDPLVLSCLVRGCRLNEGFVEGAGRAARLSASPATVAAWLKISRRISRIAALFAQIPAVYERSAVEQWKGKLVRLLSRS